jgi:hypothetical protein
MFRICNHLKTPLKFIKNIHGDMIYTAGGKRSIWVCTNCGKTILMDEPFYMGEVSDGYHTFNELYHHRAVLFSVICNDRPTLAWKSKQHHDGTMYDGMFIVGIETPDGQATYHYDIEPYWDMFCVPELPQAPEWDGHTPAQAIERIGKLSSQPENEPLTLEDGFDITNADGSPIDYDALGQKYKDQLCYCDIDGFYIGEDGRLVLMDDCGSAVWVDRGDYHVEIRKPERSEG